jgi:siroheme synthase
MVFDMEEAVMSNNLKFQPPGPYTLPAAQTATASALSDAVEVRVRAFVDGNPDTLVIQMTVGTAMELAAQLMDAAVKAKKA